MCVASQKKAMWLNLRAKKGLWWSDKLSGGQKQHIKKDEIQIDLDTLALKGQ